MADIKITNLPLGTDIADDDELLYIDVSDQTAGPDGTDKRVLVGSLRNIAERNATTEDLIASDLSSLPVGKVVTTVGFYESGDGGSGQWVKTGNTALPSRSPADFRLGRLTDSEGNVFDLVPSVAGFNTKQFGCYGDGVTGDAEYIEAAFYGASAAGFPLWSPDAEYLLERRVELLSLNAQSEINLNFTGSSFSKCVFLVDGLVNSDGAIKIQKSGPAFSCQMRNFSIRALSGGGNCGTALDVSAVIGGAELTRRLLLEDIQVLTEDYLILEDTAGDYNPANPAHFNKSFVVNYIARATLIRCMSAQPKTSNNASNIRYADTAASYLCQTAFELTDCYGFYLEYCQAHQASKGFDIITDKTSAEGAGFYTCTAVNVKVGAHIRKTETSPAGTEPGFEFINGHFNFRDYGILVEYRKRGEITGILFHHQNDDPSVGVANPIDIYIPIGNTFNIYSNEFSFDASRPERRAIQFDSLGTAGETKLRTIINSNQFNATMDYAVRSLISGTDPYVADNEYSENVGVKLYSDGKNKPVPYTQDMYSGDYVPTVTNVTGCVVTPQTIYYSVTGGMVRVYGRINVNSDNIGTLNKFDVSLPVGTDFTFDGQASGTISAVYTVTSESSTGLVSANTADDTLSVSMVAKGSTNTFCYIDVSYRINT